VTQARDVIAETDITKVRMRSAVLRSYQQAFRRLRRLLSRMIGQAKTRGDESRNKENIKGQNAR